MQIISKNACDRENIWEYGAIHHRPSLLFLYNYVTDVNFIVLLVDRKLSMLMGHIAMINEYTLILKIFK